MPAIMTEIGEMVFAGSTSLKSKDIFTIKEPQKIFFLNNLCYAKTMRSGVIPLHPENDN